jgi:hypothetical protein
MGTEMKVETEKERTEKERIFKLVARADEYALAALKHFLVFGDTLHAIIALEYALDYLGAAKIALKGLLEREKEAKG